MAEDELKIPITAEADTKGFDDTTRAAEEMQRAVEQAASASLPAQQEQEQQVKAATEAKLKEKKASEEAAAAEVKLRRAMELAAKSRNELIKELQRLAALRKDAAEAGDAEAFERLSAQSQETREAFEKLNQGLELTNIQFVQQAQMGMMAGQTLASLGQMAEGGADNVAAMAAQFLSLGQAIKAGLGPVGWAMMALQGLQMAWNYFAEKQEKAKQAAEEAEKALAKLNETLLRHAEAAAKATHAAYKTYTDERVAAEQEAAGRILDVIDRRQQAEQAAADRRLELLRAEIESQKVLLQAKLDAGKLTQAQHESQVRALDSGLRQQEQLEADAAERRQRERLDKEIETNEAIAQKRSELRDRLVAENAEGMGDEWTAGQQRRYAEITAQYEALRQTIEARRATVGAINAQMEAEKASSTRNEEKIAELRRQRTEAERDMYESQRRLEDLDNDAARQFRDILAKANENEEARHLTGVALLQYARTVNQQIMDAERAATTAWDDVEEARARLAALNEESSHRDAASSAAERRIAAEREAAAMAEYAAAREREWAEVQRMGLDAQKIWLEQEMQRHTQGSELWREYDKRLRAVNEGIAAERVTLLAAMRPARTYAQAEARTQAEIFAADRALLENKLAMLQAELADGQNLTPALRKSIQKQVVDAEKQLAGIAQAEVREKLAAARATSTTQQYQARDRRTQRQIMEADAAILKARRDELRRLKDTPRLDAAVLKQINDALKDTERQINGLEQAWQENRTASRRWLRELQPPKLQAKRKQMQNQLDALTAAYSRAAKNAERAAARGDTKAVERYRRQMERLANSIDRRAKDSQAGTRLQRQAEDALRGVSREQVTTERATKASSRAAKRKQRADEQAAKSSEKAAKDARKQANTRQNRTRDVTAELTSLRASVARMEAEQVKLNASISTLTDAVTACANAAAQGASASTSAAAATAAATQRLNGRIKNLQAQVDRIKRQL